MQSRSSRNTVELNEIFSTHSPQAKFPFNHFTAGTSVSDPDPIIKNLIDQVKFNISTEFICGRKNPSNVKLMYIYFITLTAISKIYAH